MTLAWKAVECPRCLASPGKSCVSRSGRKVTTHVLRHQRAAEDLRARVIRASQAQRPGRMNTVYLPGDSP